MCGRYITPEEADIEREWSKVPRPADYFRSHNFAPTQRGLVVIDTDPDPRKLNGRQRSIVLMTWGFQPHWANRAWINARTETVLESRAFAPAAKRQRCLVIAAGWYEWTGDKAPRQPYLFKRKDGHTFAFAGIWTSRVVEGQEVSNYAILTTAANELASPIHSRMPLVVDPLAYELWLSPESDVRDYGAVLDYWGNGDEFEVYPVSKAVNSPKNDSPELQNRVSL
jgi:putative SOS response-associated peptidase YedK